MPVLSIVPSNYDVVAKRIGADLERGKVIGPIPEKPKDLQLAKRISLAGKRRKALRDRTGMEANQIPMHVAHLLSEAINTNHKATRRRLKDRAMQIISEL